MLRSIWLMNSLFTRTKTVPKDSHELNISWSRACLISGSADRMALFPVTSNPTWRQATILDNFKWPYLRNGSFDIFVIASFLVAVDYWWWYWLYCWRVWFCCCSVSVTTFTALMAAYNPVVYAAAAYGTGNSAKRVNIRRLQNTLVCMTHNDNHNHLL